jgi:hypothetical protein
MSPPRKGRDGWREGKGQIGIDGNKDSSFGRGRNNEWTVEPRSATEGARGDGIRRVDTVKSAGQNYTSNESGLRNKLPDEDPDQGTRSRRVGTDIFDAVESQSSDSGNRIVRSGNND